MSFTTVSHTQYVTFQQELGSREFINEDLRNNPKYFAGFYWNLVEKKPSEPLKELFELLLPHLSESPLKEVVAETQRAWFQKNRWEIKNDPSHIAALKEKIEPILEKLGLSASFSTKGHFDTAVLPGGRVDNFFRRCITLSKAIEREEITVDHVAVLAGTQNLHEEELEILSRSSLQIGAVKTEHEMAQAICDNVLKPLGVKYTVIATDLGGRKPNLGQTVSTWVEWIKANHNRQEGNDSIHEGKIEQKVVVVSDPQFAAYLYLQCMDSLFKKNVLRIEAALLARPLEEEAFEQAILEKDTQDNPMVLHLDTLAKTLYLLDQTKMF